MSAFPIILSAPSGGGKTTIARGILAQRPDVGYSVSATTRQRRLGELDGVDYHFLTEATFERGRLAGEFAECAQVHGWWYGTLRREVKRVLGGGQHVMMDIDVQGARQFLKAFPESVLIFVLPPSVEVLVARLRARNTDSDESIERRLRSALHEIEAVSEYHYVVVNNELEAATGQVSAIIDAEMARATRVHGVEEKVAALLSELRRTISVNVEE
jgi:guanylate kinase